MKEARIILPVEYFADMIASRCISAINKEFGGCTVCRGTGYWKEGKELVLVVDVAYAPSDENDAKLYDIAEDFRNFAKQEEVYLRYGNGHVQMVTEKSCMDNGHGHFDLSFGGIIDAMNDLTDPGKPMADRVSAFEYLETALTQRKAA